MRFECEIDELSRDFPLNLHKVIVASYSNTYTFAPESVMVVTCAIEGAVLFNTDIVSDLTILCGYFDVICYTQDVVECSESDKLQVLEQVFKDKTKVVICTNSIVETLGLIKV